MSKPSFLLLENARDVAWHKASPRFRPITTEWDFAADRRPVVFVHGIEYASPEQVVSDFFVPFEQEAKLLLRPATTQSDIYIVSWDSRLAICETLRAKISNSISATVWQFAVRVPLFPKHMAEVELKAAHVAEYVLPYAKKMLQGLQPIVVTHSLGSYLWAVVVKRLWHEMPGHDSWGLWWNLQPAIPAGSFDASGEFHEIALAYDGVAGTQSLWYSSLDFVLGTLYRFGKKRWAMGQIGPGSAKVRTRNVSFQAWEAHGLVTLRQGAGSFFRRIGNLLHSEAAILVGFL